MAHDGVSQDLSRILGDLARAGNQLVEDRGTQIDYRRPPSQETTRTGATSTWAAFWTDQRPAEGGRCALSRSARPGQAAGNPIERRPPCQARIWEPSTTSRTRITTAAQPVLRWCWRSAGPASWTRTRVYNDNHSHSVAEPGWYTAPDGLTWTMNAQQSSKYFVLDALDSEDAISRMLCWTIHHYQVAPIAMVYGWAQAGCCSGQGRAASRRSPQA